MHRYDLKEEEVQKAVVAALELVNMRDYMFRATHTLSGGQRQRVAIAGEAVSPALSYHNMSYSALQGSLPSKGEASGGDCLTIGTTGDYLLVCSLSVCCAGALAENPRVLLLDELTTFLDVEDQFGVLSAVKNITRQGITRLAPSGSQASGQQGGQAASSQASAGQQAANNGTSPGPAIHVSAMWVTHRFEELEYADSASYMKEGKIIFTGGPEEMRAFLRKEGAAV
jgi:ABC-type glutathione transport system ATPase component